MYVESRSTCRFYNVTSCFSYVDGGGDEEYNCTIPSTHILYCQYGR